MILSTTRNLKKLEAHLSYDYMDEEYCICSCEELVAFNHVFQTLEYLALDLTVSNMRDFEGRFTEDHTQTNWDVVDPVGSTKYFKMLR